MKTWNVTITPDGKYYIWAIGKEKSSLIEITKSQADSLMEADGGEFEELPF